MPRVSASKPHFENGHIQVWLLDPLGMATRIVGPVHVTRAMTEIITADATRALLRLHQHAPARMRFFHDWRDVTGYDSDARQAILSWGIGLGAAKIARIDVLFDREKSRLLTMGVTAAQAAFSALGVEFVTHRYPDGLLTAGGAAAEPRVRIESLGVIPGRSGIPSRRSSAFSR
jgi:hypothetical protein